MTQATLGLLEKLRPPAGFRTEGALGVTYSADLLTCMAVLTTLDGGGGEQLSYGRIEAFRALDHLREKVRICHQAGRISRRDGAKYPSLALLDQVLVPLRLAGDGSFHPKVWIVRQVDGSGAERFALVVSSRNVTTSSDWDLGVALEGAIGGRGTLLPRLGAFATHCLSLGAQPERIEALGDLDRVQWTLPPHVRELDFDFQAGDDAARTLHAVWGHFPKKASRVLLLSPFIDERVIREAASRWSDVPTKRLVAGTEGLLSISLGPGREALRSLEPRQIVAASEAPDAAESEIGEASEDEIEPMRALHAKVIAMDDGRRSTIILGSNNLTSAGWRGGSTEAFVRLIGDAELCDPLWDWAGAHAQLFAFPNPGTPPPQAPVLENVRDKLHALSFRLEDGGPRSSSRLVLIDPPVMSLPDGVSMKVARYTTPRESVPFSDGESAVEISACPSALRTRFIVCVLRSDEDELAWIMAAELDPVLGDERDRQLVARLLGLREFLAYLQSLRSDNFEPGTPEGESGKDDGEAKQSNNPTRLAESVHLEGLLRQLVADSNAFEEMDKAVSRYGELIKAGSLTTEDLTLLNRFLEAWEAIREAFRQ